MLEFIVLGQIPGTGLQISFIGIILLGFLGVMIAKTLRSYYRFHKFKTNFGHFVFMSKKPVKRRTKLSATGRA